jgi:DNA-binding transcriptional regulator YdaS (Cro superfamily)
LLATFRIGALAFWQYVLYACPMNAFSAWVNKVGGADAAAKLLGVTPDAVRKWMRGDRCPRPAMAAKIEQISLGEVSRSALFWPEAA